MIRVPVSSPPPKRGRAFSVETPFFGRFSRCSDAAAAEDTASTSSLSESSARARSNPHSSTSVASLTSGASRAASSAPARVAASVFAGTDRRKRVSVTRATKCVVTGPGLPVSAGASPERPNASPG